MTKAIDGTQSGVVEKLSLLDRFLPVWIGIAMAVGLLLGRLVPGLNTALDRVQIDGVSLPIALGLLIMMYPVLAKVRYDRLDTVTIKNAPGTADYVRFYKAAADKGWIFSDPRAAKAQPGQAKATAEMYNKLAELGGIAYETDMQIKLGGSGPMAGLLARMGNVTMNMLIDSVETGAVADDLFMPPAGYKQNPKK